MLFVNEAAHSRSIKPQQAAGNLPTVIKFLHLGLCTKIAVCAKISESAQKFG
jgi:hypothetical protein